MPNKNRARTYFPTWYQHAGLSAYPPNCIPLKAYCAKYFLTKYQVLNRLRKAQICAVSFKKKLFIMDAEPMEI